MVSETLNVPNTFLCVSGKANYSFNAAPTPQCEGFVEVVHVEFLEIQERPHSTLVVSNRRVFHIAIIR